MQFDFASIVTISLITIIYLDFYKFLNRLTAYRAFIWLKPQSFGALTAQTLENATYLMWENNGSRKWNQYEVQKKYTPIIMV